MCLMVPRYNSLGRPRKWNGPSWTAARDAWEVDGTSWTVKTTNDGKSCPKILMSGFFFAQKSQKSVKPRM